MTPTLTLQAVRRASQRAAAAFHQDAKTRVDSLATVAAVAPLLGMLGTIDRIFYAIPIPGERYSFIQFVLTNLPRSVAPLALGLLIAIAALWIRHYLTYRLDLIDQEMDRGSHDLIVHLQQHWL